MLHNKSSLACLKEQHAKFDTYNDFYSYNLDMAEKDNYLKELRILMKENVNECECDMYNSNRVKLLIAGFHVDVMIDSGASISVISEEFLYTIKQQSFIDVTEMKVKTCELALRWLQWRSEGGASAPGRRPEGGAKMLTKNFF